MKTDVYKTAVVTLASANNAYETLVIDNASLVIHPCGFAEIVHYKKGDKSPDNKRTIIIPSTSLICFRAHGYGN